MVVSYEYDAYGNILNSTETGTVTIGDGTLLWHANPFRYAGYYYDKETWMYYLNARYYKARLSSIEFLYQLRLARLILDSITFYDHN